MNPQQTGMLMGSLLGLFIVGMGAWGFNHWLKGGDVEDVAEHLPANTLVLLSFRGFTNLYLEFGDELEAISDSRRTEDSIEEFEEVFGFDPTNPDSLMETGFSFSEAWGIAVLGDPMIEWVDLVILVPIDDEEAVLDFLDDRFDELEMDVEEEEVEDIEAYVVDEQMAWLIDGDYLLACVPTNRKGGMGEDRAEWALDCLEDLVHLDSDDSLASDEHFIRAMDLADPDWNLMVYSTTEWMSELANLEGSAPEPVLDFLEDVVDRCPATVSTLSIEREQVRAQSTNIIDSDHAHLFNMDGEDDLADRIPGEPIAVARTSLHLHAAWSVLNSWEFLEEETEGAWEEAEDELGIDLEEDLIANFTGHFSMVLLEGSRRGDQPVDLVIYAPIEDGDLALDTLEELVDAAEDNGFDLDEEDAGEGIYFVTEERGVEFCFGLARDHLVLAAGEDRCETVFEGIDEGGESFLDELPSDAEEGLEDGPPSYGFLAVDRLVDIVKKQEGVGETEEDALDLLVELIESVEMKAWSEPGYSTFELLIVPPEEDFGPGIEALAEMVADELDH